MSTQYDIPYYQFLLPLVVFQVYNAFSNFGVVASENIHQHTKYKSGISPYSLVFLGSLALFLSWILKLYIYRQGKNIFGRD